MREGGREIYIIETDRQVVSSVSSSALASRQGIHRTNKHCPKSLHILNSSRDEQPQYSDSAHHTACGANVAVPVTAKRPRYIRRKSHKALKNRSSV